MKPIQGVTEGWHNIPRVWKSSWIEFFDSLCYFANNIQIQKTKQTKQNPKSKNFADKVIPGYSEEPIANPYVYC